MIYRPMYKFLNTFAANCIGSRLVLKSVTLNDLEKSRTAFCGVWRKRKWDVSKANYTKTAKSINQSINQRKICRALLYDTSRSANSSQSFSERISVSNIVEIRRKSVSGGWATIGEALFSKFSSCSWQNVIR